MSQAVPDELTQATGWLGPARVARFEHRVLALMLLSLHGVLWLDPGGGASRALLLAHVGLFLIWQPIWGRRARVEPVSAGLFLVIIVAFVVWFDWLLLMFWMLLVCGFVGGRVTPTRRDRITALVALLFLVCELLVAVVPPLANLEPLPETAAKLFAYSFAFVPLVIFALPDRGPAAERRNMDFLYGASAAMLAAVLGLGSLLTMFLAKVDYSAAVVMTVLSTAGFMLALSFLWTPLSGSTGLGQVWQVHLQNIGTPFERWLGQLAGLSEASTSPPEFLDEAMDQLHALPWVRGVQWTSVESQGQIGERTHHSFVARTGDLEVTVHTRHEVGVALRLHCNLLVQLVSHFYVAKLRERALLTSAHMRAVHETGARLTHDIKNLLQSLHAMTIILERSQGASRDEAQALVLRQLPQLRERLESTLGKLQAPSQSVALLKPIKQWWEGAGARHSITGVELDAKVDSNRLVPGELFDRVTDNLLENARFKRLSEPDIKIRLDLLADVGSLELGVSDTGHAIDAGIARKLFHSPVNSRGGLGIGLYQVARDAIAAGYRLRLASNVDGNVRFTLTPLVARDDSAA